MKKCTAGLNGEESGWCFNWIIGDGGGGGHSLPLPPPLLESLFHKLYTIPIPHTPYFEMPPIQNETRHGAIYTPIYLDVSSSSV